MPIVRKLPEAFVETEVDGEVLLIDLDGGELFSLTGTARAIWLAIDGSRDVPAIAASLANAYDGDAAAIRSECESFVAQLAEARLVVVN
ncbi:PqqD family protein [Qipengyuania marisflavi]|uniref:PqqD family protein n=1 Tax=Qipengyuania marisflavi TaxID=2486356 RepID=A0A5S3P5H6_9SPHN|nr:PqqD family protein [Qipengyuania marisflavi]TMM48290.1 PqqD family protein [Qipengyuania marisflavi]